MSMLNSSISVVLRTMLRSSDTWSMISDTDTWSMSMSIVNWEWLITKELDVDFDFEVLMSIVVR